MAAELTALRLTVAALLILFTGIFLRILYIIPVTKPRQSQTQRKPRQTPCHLLIVLGSGGHTAEMISMLRNLDIKKYSPRTYVVSSGDDFSSSKAVEFENHLLGNHGLRGARSRSKKETVYEKYEIITVPRARNIHQPLYTTLFSSLRCLTASVMLLANPSQDAHKSRITTSPDLIITNGPATGVIVVMASLIVKFFGLQKNGDMRSIYVESWARVKTLSLSGKILYYLRLTDRFLVQWESLARGRAEYRGPMVE